MMLGHQSPALTLSTYSRLYLDDLEALAERLDEKYRTVA